MARFGKRSLSNLTTCHVQLQQLFERVVHTYDCSILCGHRDKKDQDLAFEEGKSQLRWPDGNHNKNPSTAVDVSPWPIDWKNRKRFYHFAGYVMGIAEELDIPIRWGGDWDSDKDLDDQNFLDLPHFELRQE